MMQVDQKLFAGLDRIKPVMKQEKPNRVKQRKRQIRQNEDLIEDSLAALNQTYEEQYADMSLLGRRTTTIDEDEQHSRSKISQSHYQPGKPSIGASSPLKAGEAVSETGQRESLLAPIKGVCSNSMNLREIKEAMQDQQSTGFRNTDAAFYGPTGPQ